MIKHLMNFQGSIAVELRRLQLLSYTVAAKGTPETIVFNIFQRINTGGGTIK